MPKEKLFFFLTFQTWIQVIACLAKFQCTCEVRVYCVARSDVDHILCWGISPEIQGAVGWHSFALTEILVFLCAMWWCLTSFLLLT